MSQDHYCAGCGIPLQSTDPGKEGYIPPEKSAEGGALLCRRCFRISHYGEYLPATLTPEDYRNEVNSALDRAGVVLAVMDIVDFEGSFQEEILDILRDCDSIVIVNKVDLIIREKHPSKIADWVKRRLAAQGIAPLEIAIVSTKSGYGVSGVYKKLKTLFPGGTKAVVIGVTNTGKSSLINRITGKKRITVSKYPGTTLRKVDGVIADIGVKIVDTPGLIPRGRIS
ncbi:MAG: 50S ribosome-binding GTPase, partial [Fusobacteriaceae bacterium]|nr:50S ribosome-binding GTPase [Fusobacteriaceae bacterium]